MKSSSRGTSEEEKSKPNQHRSGGQLPQQTTPLTKVGNPAESITNFFSL